MLTSRDLDVIDFLDKFKIASTSTISTLLFNGSLRCCQKRLTVLVNAKKIKRFRSSINMEYIYYTKMPKQRKHAMYLTEFYAQFYRTHDVVRFIPEIKLTNIRPDALIVYKENNRLIPCFLEIEISNKGFDYHKYEKYALSRNFSELKFQSMPKIIIVPKNNKSSIKLGNDLVCKYDIMYLEKEILL